MKYIADFHVHSKYSRATSPEMSPEGLWRWSQLKGIKVVGTGDFTHPVWSAELQEKLEPAAEGLFALKKKFRPDTAPESCKTDISFILSAEISCIYRKNDKTRKVHCIVIAPAFDDALRINKRLSLIGNLSADGRPILGLDAKELLKIVMEESPDALLIPAHIWTPHFSVFGAVSGFDSLEECFEELTPHIHALETGLSSNPQMNWRLSCLDAITLISNSDAHSTRKLGREANILDAEISYPAILSALKTRRGFAGTIEFYPEEGKYYADGHRACGVCLSPEETIRHNYLCPVCGKKVTVGVLHRVARLADRQDGFKPKGAPSYQSIIPLAEIIAEARQVGVNSKAVEKIYFQLLEEHGNEFRILLEVPVEDIERSGFPRVAEAIAGMRANRICIAPGYDGEFGKIKIFEKVKRKELKGQALLF
ncbi:MAG: DNA helicase UvrD [Nitrospira bacterium HGW-Nitrospira-1]|nr:MAG: DNA helicase UvrD [Nitrospira bacterium HGW-Nitrospira-1]